jgi:serine phosphatase RsbU (regulator of sigma subunit)
VKFPVKTGDSLLLYTDCLIEARDENGEHFGVDGL